MSHLSEVSSKAWRCSSQGRLFLNASAHALWILNDWHTESAASVESRRPEIIRLGLRLTELLRHDLLTALLENDSSLNFFDLATWRFPWHGALQCFVDCMPAEMGALLRFLMHAPYEYTWQWDRVNALAALFPSNSDADSNLESMIMHQRTRRSQSAPQPNTERTAPSDIAHANETTDAPSSGDVTAPGPALAATIEGSLHHSGASDLSIEPEIGRLANVQVSDSEQNQFNPDAASREASQAAMVVDNRVTHHTIDIPPAVLPEPENASSANAADHSTISPERNSRHPAHQQAAKGFLQLIGHNPPVGEGPVEGVDRAHLSDDGWSNV
jgi:hypothetical protein